MKHAAIYYRVSSNKQDIKSQQPDLKRWTDNHEGPVKIYKDKQSGKTMDRPGWNKLQDDINTGKIHTLVVWRLDRLGRTTRKTVKLFDELKEKKINLVSIKDAVDLSTPAGRHFARSMASAAQYESEVLGERVRAGQAVARKAGKRWGGSKKGKPKKVTPQIVKTIRRLKQDNEPIAAIARTVKLSRQTIYKVMDQHAIK